MNFDGRVFTILGFIPSAKLQAIVPAYGIAIPVG